MVYNLFIMTENAPSPVFYASAKPEAPKVPQKEDSKLVKGVKNTLNKWWERVGPKGVEDHFVKAHENVLKTFNNEDRAKAYLASGDKWKKWGKALGFGATVIDAGLAGLGIGITKEWYGNPRVGRTAVAILGERTNGGRGVFDEESPNPTLLRQLYLKISPNIFSNGVAPNELLTNDNTTHPKVLEERAYASKIGSIVSLIPGLATLFPLLGAGPAHSIMHLAAYGAEQAGKMKARTNNYVDSGKAAEHASKVGNAIGKAATETAKWAAEHPDEIRRTVETVSKVKKEQAESAQKIAQAKQKAADAKLDAEYADWVAHHPDKVYFEQSGTTPPSKAEYVEMKAREAAAKKANKEAEERGVAKR
jgi:hypothetical protein